MTWSSLATASQVPSGLWASSVTLPRMPRVSTVQPRTPSSGAGRLTSAFALSGAPGASASGSASSTRPAGGSTGIGAGGPIAIVSLGDEVGWWKAMPMPMSTSAARPTAAAIKIPFTPSLSVAQRRRGAEGRGASPGEWRSSRRYCSASGTSGASAWATSAGVCSRSSGFLASMRPSTAVRPGGRSRRSAARSGGAAC